MAEREVRVFDHWVGFVLYARQHVPGFGDFMVDHGVRFEERNGQTVVLMEEADVSLHVSQNTGPPCHS